MQARRISAAAFLLLCGSSLWAAPPESVLPAQSTPEARSAEQLRDAVRAAMKRTNAMAERSVADRIDEPAVLELVELYLALITDTQLPADERGSLTLQVHNRLSRIGKTIDRSLKRTAKAISNKTTAAKTAVTKTADAKPTTSMAASSSTSVEGTKGGGPVDHGQELLNLIKATIAPDSWDDAGGNGSIYYWSAWHVLVIRQTDEVHEQIEGLLKALR
jgi:hypothetical protein